MRIKKKIDNSYRKN